VKKSIRYLSETASIDCTTCEKLIVDIVRNPCVFCRYRVQNAGHFRAAVRMMRSSNARSGRVSSKAHALCAIKQRNF